MRPITRLTLIGTAIPIALFMVAAVLDVPTLAIVALAVAIVSPSLGHVVCRRKFFTRGTIVRLLGAGCAAVCVVGARGSPDLGGAIGMMFMFAVLALVAFIAGTALDLTRDA